jgi:hypothetical protein
MAAEHSRIENMTAEFESQRLELVRREQELEHELSALAQRASESLAEDSLANEREAEDKTPFEPTSAAEVIARLSSSGVWKDSAVDAELDDEAEAASPEPAWKSLVAEDEPTTTSPAATVSVVEEEDSIENYMQRLLKRVSGDTETTRVVASPIVERPAAAPDEPSLPIPSLHGSANEETPFDPSSYRPRSAPEKGDQLAAMRQLANQSARVAIDSSGKRTQRRRVKSLATLVLISALAAVASLWFATVYGFWLGYVGALAASGAAVVWGLQLVVVRFRRCAGKPEAAKPAEQPVAAEPQPVDDEATLVQPIIPVTPVTPEATAVDAVESVLENEELASESEADETSIELTFDMPDTAASERGEEPELDENGETPSDCRDTMTFAELEASCKSPDADESSAADGGLPLGDGLPAVTNDSLASDEITPRDEA